MQTSKVEKIQPIKGDIFSRDHRWDVLGVSKLPVFFILEKAKNLASYLKADFIVGLFSIALDGIRCSNCWGINGTVFGDN